MGPRRHPPLPPRTHFLRHVARNAALAGGLVSGSLALGVLGYHLLAGLSWIDALVNASMILTGMGPVNEMTTVGAKLFASFYALFSGVAFLTIVAVLLAPAVHRFLHRFHLDLAGDQDDGKKP
ncbi:MAG TPA: hypothetical protein VN898_11500 [Candidatus Binatia bacterium]|nr:hypothetical protein [Candidatus Binatia bacterium]